MLGDSLRRVRKAQGLTVSEVARRAGIDRRHLGKIESGEIPSPGVETVSRISRALGVPAEEFVLDPESAPSPRESLTPLQRRWLTLLDMLPPQRVPDAYAEVARLAADPNFDLAMKRAAELQPA